MFAILRGGIVTKEQKEGVLITTVSMTILLTLALLTSWEGGFSDATFYFNGFETSCETKIEPPTGWCDRTVEFCINNVICPDGVQRSYQFDIKFRTILILFIPIIAYGLLRSFGIIRRFFQFEEKLFKFIDK